MPDADDSDTNITDAIAYDAVADVPDAIVHNTVTDATPPQF